MGNWVCIDFGTCNSAAAIEIDGRPKLVSPNNVPFFPTVACVLSRDKIVVCQNAESFKTHYPESFLQEFKLDIANSPDCNGVDYQKVVAEILRYIKGCSEVENNGARLDRVILTIPAIYTEQDSRKDIMRLAALDAGFTTVEFLREPQAAAWYYAYINDSRSAGLSLIYDLGGGTFDPALMDMGEVDNPTFLGCNSGVKCGGQYFDAAVYKKAQKEATDMDKPLVREKRWNDYEACKKLKESLSASPSGTIILSNDEFFSLNREGLNALIGEKLDLTLSACDSMLKTTHKEWTHINQVLLVGGSTSIPLVSEKLRQHLASHNASEVRIIRSMTGINGEYNHNYAVCLGGIAYIERLLDKQEQPPMAEEQIGILICGNEVCQLKEGVNTFGRSSEQDFSFSDPAMSREHFTIDVSRNSSGHYEYLVTTMSQKKATIINDRLALNLNVPFAPRNIALVDGATIQAGVTRFQFKK